MKSDPEIAGAVAMGRRNQHVMTLVQNWCAHAKIEQDGGGGLLEAQSGLPIGPRHVACPHARRPPVSGSELAGVALVFHDNNCVGCTDRKPVRQPDLSELVQERDAREGAANVARASRAQQAEVARQHRSAKRTMLRTHIASPAESSVWDLLDSFDQNPTNELAAQLTESARAVPAAFTDNVEAALVEMASAVGNALRTRVSLELLDHLGRQRTRLTALALSALARNEAIEQAGAIVARGLESDHQPLLHAALPTIVYLARPVPSRFYDPPRIATPGALHAAFRIDPSDVEITIRRCLRADDKEIRRAGAYAFQTLLNLDPGIAERRFGDLVAGFSRPDDMYEDGEASYTIAWALADALHRASDRIDARLQSAYVNCSDEEGIGILRTYMAVLSVPPPRRTPEPPVAATTPEVERLAFGHLVNVISRLPGERLLREVTRFFDDRCEGVAWDSVATVTPALLGTAAIGESEIAALSAGPAALVDPRDPAIGAIERMARQGALRNACAACVYTVVRVANDHPDATVRESIIDLLLGTIERLPPTADRLRAGLIAELGKLAARPAALRRILPAVYRAMTDNSPRTRGAAAQAYAHIATAAGLTSLPTLLVDALSVLILDPKVAVHQSALRALDDASVPEEHRPAICNQLTRLLALLTRGNRALTGYEAETVALALDLWIPLVTGPEKDNSHVAAFAVSVARQLPVDAALPIVQFHGNVLHTAPGFADLVVDLLTLLDIRPSAGAIIFRALDRVPHAAIRRVADRLGDAAIRLQERHWDVAFGCLIRLSEAGSWDTAQHVVTQAVAQAGADRARRGRRLKAEAHLAIVEMEIAARDGRPADMARCALRFRAAQSAIRENDADSQLDVATLLASS